MVKHGFACPCRRMEGHTRAGGARGGARGCGAELLRFPNSAGGNGAAFAAIAALDKGAARTSRDVPGLVANARTHLLIAVQEEVVQAPRQSRPQRRPGCRATAQALDLLGQTRVYAPRRAGLTRRARLWAARVQAPPSRGEAGPLHLRPHCGANAPRSSPAPDAEPELWRALEVSRSTRRTSIARLAATRPFAVLPMD